MSEANTWIILREPGCVPQRKGPFPSRNFKATLREFMEARPRAFITVLTWHPALGPEVEDGPQCLEIMDGRYRNIANHHRESTRHAFAMAK